jgi:hypothetical protein
MIRLVEKGLWARNGLLEAQNGSSDDGVGDSEIIFGRVSRLVNVAKAPGDLGNY